jgi:hypothetical protein
MDDNKLPYFLRDQDHACRVEGVRMPVRIAEVVRRLNSGEGSFSDLPLAQVCQLRRLYQLFGCDHATWEVVAAERVNEGWMRRRDSMEYLHGS